MMSLFKLSCLIYLIFYGNLLSILAEELTAEEMMDKANIVYDELGYYMYTYQIRR